MVQNQVLDVVGKVAAVVDLQDVAQVHIAVVAAAVDSLDQAAAFVVLVVVEDVLEMEDLVEAAVGVPDVVVLVYL